MLRGNLHTHTYRCQHASGDALDYARVAAQQGCRILGISDHTPLPDDRWPSVRMKLAELDDYCAAVAAAERAIPEVQVLLGLECEYIPAFHHWYADELRWQRGCHYLIAATHWVPMDDDWVSAFGTLHEPRLLRAYISHCERSLSCGLFDFLAHPDLIGCSPVAWNADFAACARAIAACARDCEVALELNTYGPRKRLVHTPTGARPMYPWRPFWEIVAEEGASVVVNSDAHRPQDVADDGGALIADLIDDLGLTVIDLAGRLAERVAVLRR